MKTAINHINSKKQNKVILLLLLLTGFFGLSILNIPILRYFYIGILFYFLYNGKLKQDKYGNFIIAYFIFVTISCISSFIHNGQNPIKVLTASYPCLGLLFYFALTKYKVSIQETENIIVRISIIFCLCYVMQWLIYPTVIFSGAEDTTNINSDQFRMRMPGSICSYILFFLGLNRFLVYKNKLSLLYIGLGFIPIIIMGFRSLIALCLCSTIVMIIFIENKYLKKIITIISAIGISYIIVSNVPLIHNKVEEMMQRQESNQTFDNSDYIRYVCYNHFNDYVYKDKIERIIGGGYPLLHINSQYSNKHKLAVNHSLYWVDLGIVGLSFIIGIPAVLLLTFIILLTSYKAKSKNLQYIRFTLLTVLGGSIFTSMELFRECNMLITSVLIYLIYKSYEEY